MKNITIATENKRGFTYKLSEYGKAFVSFANRDKKVMDIGAAYGVATIPALKKGARVVAFDLQETHLKTLYSNTPIELRKNLELVSAKFPYIEFETSSFDAIYISQVLPFLSGDEITMAIEQLSCWLKKDGKLFIVSFTPYLDYVKSYLPEFERKRKAGKKWPGYIENLSKYSDDESIAVNLPNNVHHIDEMDISMLLFKNGFMIEKLEYFGSETDELPKGIEYDGRERLGIIARKL
ncbi:class I SAM-dependent methyltransferase [Chondrinema litorale]|uniref:class I SAM-dependent methyltransferase n=1 Tax=Chondrinema litorale TaxID=2994555 RepID=UPI002543A7CE|nr:class I SAM-dependent methyltransferase [Chondrinema litorale]UZR96893.1 class I SAM-dependent methyltransferase [Chondrinema litorale]